MRSAWSIGAIESLMALEGCETVENLSVADAGPALSEEL